MLNKVILKQSAEKQLTDLLPPLSPSPGESSVAGDSE